MSLADQASLLLIPTGYKSQKVYSIFPTDGDGDFDFSRSGSATRIAKNGLITTVAANVPRLNYPLIDGVVSGCPSFLLEPQRSNLFTYSEAINQGSWVKSNANITENSAISPNGTQNAETFTITSNFGYFYKAQSLASGTTVTQSIFVKNIDADRINLQVRTASTAGLASFFFTNSEITSVELTNGISADFDNYGNGWYRVYLTCTTTETNQLFRFQLSQSGMSCYVWGAMVEQGSCVSSYIPTTTSAATRSAETCNNSGNADTFNDSEGVLMAEISSENDNSTKIISLASTSGSENTVWIGYADGVYGIVRSGGVTVVETNIFPTQNNEITKCAILYSNSNVKFYINGFNLFEDTNVSMPIGLDQLRFSRKGGSLPFYGNTKQVQYHNSALTDSELEQLTSWTSFTDMAQGQLYSVE
jgi:hypothetical protein